MPDIVIVAYQPKPGCQDKLKALVKDHVPMLQRLGLATARAPVVMRNREGTFVEVFEWEDSAMAKAHDHPDVQALWAQYEAVCDYVPLNTLPEAENMFAEFKPVDV